MGVPVAPEAARQTDEVAVPKAQEAPAIGATQELPTQRPPSRMPILVAALIALGGVGAAVAVIGSSGSAPAPTLAAPADAAIIVPADSARAIDAAPPADAGVADASIPDARPRLIRKRIDARPAPKPGSVRVAANPWADVYFRGKRLGRAPGKFSLPSGTHTLELRRGDVTKKISVTVRPGELTSLPLADLTGN